MYPHGYSPLNFKMLRHMLNVCGLPEIFSFYTTIARCDILLEQGPHCQSSPSLENPCCLTFVVQGQGLSCTPPPRTMFRPSCTQGLSNALDLSKLGERGMPAKIINLCEIVPKMCDILHCYSEICTPHYSI